MRKGREKACKNIFNDLLPPAFNDPLPPTFGLMRFMTFVHLPFSQHFFASLVSMKGTLCGVILRNCK